MIPYKKLARKLNGNKEGRVLLENFLSLSILQAINFIFPLITLPYLARTIGLDGFGEITFAASVIVYFETLTTYGFNFTAVRDLSKIKNDLTLASQLFSTVIFAKLFLMLVSLLAMCLLIYTVPLFYEKRLLLFLTFFYIPGHLFFPEWVFQALQKMKVITVVNFLSRLLFTALVFVFIREKSDYILYPLLNAAGFTLSGALSLYFIFFKYKLRFIIPKWNDIVDILKSNFNMFISLFLPNLYTNLSVNLLGAYGGMTATGIYSSGKRFIDLCTQISGVLSRTFFPFLARRIDKHSLYSRISGGISILMSVILFFGAEFLVDFFYTEEFREAAIVIKIMAFSPPFLFLMNAYGTNYLVLQGREDILRNIIIVCSLIGGIFAYFCVVYYSHLGVAVAVTFTWAIRGIITWLYAQRIKKTSV